MAQHTHRCELRLTEQEHTDLVRKAEKAGLSISSFIRRTVAGCTIKEAPPTDVPRLIQEIRRVGSNISQILMIANSQGLLNIPDLHKAILDLREVEKLIVYQYTK